jgi:lipid-binding SYLF domain-containing protein
MGGELTDYVILLNTPEAVEAFTGAGQVVLGASLSLAVGPVGREAASEIHANLNVVAPAYSYSFAKGAFVGLSLEGSAISTMASKNRNLYGRVVEPTVLLMGKFPWCNLCPPPPPVLLHCFANVVFVLATTGLLQLCLCTRLSRMR